MKILDLLREDLRKIKEADDSYLRQSYHQPSGQSSWLPDSLSPVEKQIVWNYVNQNVQSIEELDPQNLGVLVRQLYYDKGNDPEANNLYNKLMQKQMGLSGTKSALAGSQF